MACLKPSNKINKPQIRLPGYHTPEIARFG
jgi:hypothetical protein